jgi:Asp-tRNA(Asn)/Glu-tRNA(Gln) amidotransferase A subunit family amidase
VSDLRIVCKAIGAFPQSARTSHHIPTAVERFERASTLTIGVIRTDGWFEPHPAVSRAVNETAANLSALGYLVEEFELPFSPDEFVPLVAALITRDEWEVLGEAVSQNSDPGSSTGTLWEHVAAAEGSHVTRRAHVNYMPSVSRFAALPPFLRRAFVWFVRHVLQQERSALILQGVSKGLCASHTQLLTLRAELAEHLELAMSEAGVDAVLMPPAGIPAGGARSRCKHSLLPAFVYSALCSVLGFPSGGVPVTHVRPSDLAWTKPAVDAYDSRARNVTVKSEGVPVGCSVFAAPFQDDVCLEIMHDIEEAANFQHDPPSLGSFLSTWPGPQRGAQKPQETSPLLASESQDWTHEFTSTVALKLRRMLRIPSVGGQQDLWSLGTV